MRSAMAAADGGWVSARLDSEGRGLAGAARCARARAGAENAGRAWQCVTHTNCGLAPVDADKGGGKQGSGSMGAVLLVRM